MSESKTVKIWETCEQINGVPYKPADVYDTLIEKATLLLRANNIFENAPSRAQQYIRKNDILILTVRSNFKNIAINKIEYKEPVASSGFYVLRPKYVLDYLFIAVLQDKFTSDMVAVTTSAIIH